VAILSDIRDGLAVNLSGISGLQVPDRGFILANPTPPAAEIIPGGPAGVIEYDLAFQRGLDKIPFTVRVYVSLTSDIGSQATLDEYIEPSGSRSVKEALESDTTLGGAANDLRVTSCSGPQQFIREGKPPVLGAEWHVDVYANGT
jgi:hypothetical protein